MQALLPAGGSDDVGFRLSGHVAAKGQSLLAFNRFHHGLLYVHSEAYCKREDKADITAAYAD